MRKKSSRSYKQRLEPAENLKSNLAELCDASAPFVIAGVVTGAAEMVDVEEIVKVSVLAKRIQAIPIPGKSDDVDEVFRHEDMLQCLWGKMIGSLLHGSVRGLS
jgi:hypothetical protein